MTLTEHTEHETAPAKARTESRLLKLSEARVRLSISETKLYELVQEGRLQIVKIGSASRIRETDVECLIASLPRATLRRKARVVKEAA
jgi:excisionase family DNA binding protein